MINNDILRRVRYVFDFSDSKVIALFDCGGLQVTRPQLSLWLKKEDEPEFQACSDRQLAAFLNGLIIEKRGKKDGVERAAEVKLTNNMILTKLKIALDLKAEDVLAIMQLAECVISKHELSAFFRKPGHKHYRECLDQVLRNFLNGLNLKYRKNVELGAKKATDSP